MWKRSWPAVSLQEQQHFVFNKKGILFASKNKTQTYNMCRNGRHILSKIRHVLRFALLVTSLRSCPLTIILLYKKKTSDHRLLNNFKNEIYQVIEWQCYYLWGLSKVELILINAHFSYARAALEMFCTLSYAQITFLWLLLNVYYSNSTIRL